MKKSLFFLLATAAGLLSAENIIRNGGFDYPAKLNGSNMYIGVFDVGCRIISTQPQRLWRTTPYEGWWIAAGENAAPKITEEKGFIRLSGKGYALTSIPQKPASGNVVLSLDVRTKNAAGKIVLQSMNHDGGYGRVVYGTKEAPLPANTNGKFERITIVYPDFKELACARIEIDGGTIDIDNVQIEDGEKATPFNVRKEDMLELSMGHFSSARFPRFYQKSGVQKITVRSHSAKPLTGTLKIYLDNWLNPGKTLFAKKELLGLAAGKTVQIDVDVSKLEPDAYIVFAELTGPDGKVLVSAENLFDPEKTGSGAIGESMLKAHNAMRFGVYRDIKPAEIFGVGNSMVGNQSYWSGCGPKDYITTRKLHYASHLSRYSDGELFNTAVGNAETLIGDYAFDHAEADRPDLSNPARPGSLDYYHPEAFKIMMKRAEEVGKDMGKDPGYTGLKMINEAVYLSAGGTYPTAAADAAFRAWVKARYKTIEAVNKAWHTDYKDWNEIEQIVSAKMVNEKTTVEKTGAAAVDWMANIGTLTGEVGKIVQANPGRAMDWFRWRTASSLALFKAFHDKVKEYAPDKIVGINMAWPNFWPQIMMPFWRITDAPMLDMQYIAGYSVDLGCEDEMIDMLEMAESTVPDKPVWGIEIYLQPTFKDKAPAIQNWGLVAHGMTNNLVFAWKPYADVGYGIFTEPRVWEKNNKKTPMWLMIDTDGTELPIYADNNRSVLEIEEFHKKYNALSMKRMKSRTGYFLSTDTQEWITMETLNRPFGGLTGTRITIGAQMRLAGATLNYLDDESLLAMKDGTLDTIIVPPAPVMSDEVLEKLADFAKKGGNLVLLGPCGVYDPCLNLRKEYGGGKWAKRWTVPEKWQDRQLFRGSFTTPEEEMNSVKGFAGMPDGKPVKFNGKVVGRTAPLGKGRVFAMILWPARYGGRYIKEPFKKYLAEFIKCMKIPTPAIWKNDPQMEKLTPGARPGEGKPLVEVVLREKSPKERFLFVMNQGGEGSGSVVLSEEWNAEDIFSGKKTGKTKTIPLKMEGLGYKVFRLTK